MIPSKAPVSTRSSPSVPARAAAAAPAAATSSSSPPQHVVVVGAGIVGSSTAFFLRRRDPSLKITLVDAAAKVASAASGKAGGFLARDWSGDPLMRAGFDLHAQLAEEFGAEEVGYRRMRTVSASFSMTSSSSSSKNSNFSSSPPSVAPWLSPAAARVSAMGDEATTAQVHPELLTRRLAERSGAVLELGAEVSGLTFDPTSSSSSSSSNKKSSQQHQVSSVSLRDGRELRADAVVLALGPWMGQAARSWDLPAGISLPEISGQRAHSVVLKPSSSSSSKEEKIYATAVFAAVARQDRVAEPEFYPRADGTVYVCGESDDAPLPSAAEAAERASSSAGEENGKTSPSSSSPSFDPKRTAMLRQMAAVVSPGALGPETSELVTEQACYLPVPPPRGNGLPIISLVSNTDNLFVCGGHSCWGILKGPVSGQRVAEMVVEALEKGREERRRGGGQQE